MRTWGRRGQVAAVITDQLLWETVSPEDGIRGAMLTYIFVHEKHTVNNECTKEREGGKWDGCQRGPATRGGGTIGTWANRDVELVLPTYATAARRGPCSGATTTAA